MSLLDKIRKYISYNNLLDNQAKVIVGLSGGADSTALLLALLQLGYHTHAVHCNFHLRGTESDRDQQFVTNLCKKLNVPLSICNYDTTRYAAQHGISIEMAARELRYADFDRIMKECGASAVCIAHHRDDSVETILLNLIRGTGIKGLTGIKPRNGNIIRPLLCVSRQEILDWLHEIDQPYVTDSTNLETDYTRNKIRLQLLPLMRSINPDADNAIAETANHLQQAYTVYIQSIRNAADNVICNDNNELSISIPELNKYPASGAILFEILSPLGFNSTQINDIEAAMNSQPGTRFISATHTLIKDRESFIVSPIDQSYFKSITLNLVPGTTVTLPDGRRLTVATAPAGTPISAHPDVATFDAALLKDHPVTIRYRQDGDWFIPFGMKGRKLVSDYLTDSKISTSKRDRQLVITFNKDIIWLIGQRTDNRYRVTPQTSQLLILTLS